eukprot:UN08022
MLMNILHNKTNKSLNKKKNKNKYLEGKQPGDGGDHDDDDIVRQQQGDDFSHLNKTNAKASVDITNITSTLQALDDGDDENSIIDGQQQQQPVEQKDPEFEYAQIAKLGQLDAATITAQVRNGVLQQFQQQNNKNKIIKKNNVLS